ncbi:sugar ABC transporter substrate-binding protein [Clostridium uliginosum]|uniref:D-xylose transport system substrate-binding protein n=1 Tax=Clostridium uliginosum TaxID=119641 RepID=A0A1I1R6G9_9CLOT|nr:substrate-binding domain-containing protein [Clostridium uliginosum]SFD29926.1 D-xylose transport system substrate-binding protein [Clostridium uliginosum]
MYLSMPDIFFVPICYVEKDILNIKKLVILQKYNSNSYFIDETLKRKEIVIGISLPSQREDRWIRDKELMEKLAKEKGVTVKIENADTDVAKQALQVDNLISQGIDILILAPTDSVASAAMVEKAKKAGIKVIAYDRFIKNSDVDLYIAFNGIRIGELQGRFLTLKVPKGNYIIMSGDPNDDNSALIKEGAMKYIKPLADINAIKIVTDKAVDNWDPKNALKIVEESLAANKNKIDAILAPNDVTAGVAIQALESQGLAGKVQVTGMDGDLSAAQRIVQGTQLMTVLKDSRELARTAIDAAIKLAKGEPIDITTTIRNVPTLLLTPIAVDKTNIDAIFIDSGSYNTGYYKKEDVYKMK